MGEWLRQPWMDTVSGLLILLVLVLAWLVGEVGSPSVNCRRLPNLGTFRAYVSAYLGQHPKIHRAMTCMGRVE